MPESHMRREIREIPELLLLNADQWMVRARQIEATLEVRPNLVLVGRGSSGHACTYANYLHGVRTGRVPIDFRPWVSTLDRRASWKDSRALAFSASGESTDVAHACEWLRASGAEVVGVTNAEDRACRLASVCDEMIHLDMRREHAVPATKTFVAQLLAAAAMVGYDITKVKSAVASAIQRVIQGPYADELANLLTGARSVVWVARGAALAAAEDAALKLQETVGIIASGWSAAELLHGPIGARTAADRAVLLDDGEGVQSLDAVASGLVARGTPFVVVHASGAPSGVHAARTLDLEMPTTGWACTPVFAALSQQTALLLAERAGRNPDVPPGLSKVTLT